MRTALKRIGLGLAFVSVVVLLTATFSVLGAISCAVVSGMIMGAARPWRRLGLLVSLIFPAVTLSLAQISKALPARQSLLFALVCFGAFWISYLLTLGLVFMERKPEPRPVARLAGPAPAADRTELNPRLYSAAPVAAPLGMPPAEPNVEELRGKWLCETGGGDGHSHKRIIEITDGQLIWTDINSQGHRCLLAQGAIKLDRLGPFNILRVLANEAEPSASSSRTSILAPTWIYRLADRAFNIATHFEAAASGLEPSVETYRRITICNFKFSIPNFQFPPIGWERAGLRGRSPISRRSFSQGGASRFLRMLLCQFMMSLPVPCATEPMELAPGIYSTPGVSGGDACVGGTRIAVWVLESYRRGGMSERDLLAAYLTLSLQNLAHAWAYAGSHPDEIDRLIRENESGEGD